MLKKMCRSNFDGSVHGHLSYVPLPNGSFFFFFLMGHSLFTILWLRLIIQRISYGSCCEADCKAFKHYKRLVKRKSRLDHIIKSIGCDHIHKAPSRPRSTAHGIITRLDYRFGGIFDYRLLTMLLKLNHNYILSFVKN